MSLEPHADRFEHATGADAAMPAVRACLAELTANASIEIAPS